MGNYRINCDFYFVPKKSFKYKGDTIVGTSISVLVKLFNKNNREIFADYDGNKRVIIVNDIPLYFPKLVECTCDYVEVIKLNINTTLLSYLGCYNYSFEIKQWTKQIEKGDIFFLESSKEEFDDIMKTQKDNFNNDRNNPTSGSIGLVNKAYFK